MRKRKLNQDDVIAQFILRFQAKANALPHEYLLMQTTHYTWILTPVRRTGERLVIWHLER